MTEIITNNLKELSERILRGIASVEELAAEKIENVIAIKRDSVPHWRTAAINDPEKGERGRSFRFIASDETADRAGDIIRVSGWDFKNFKKNPVALWGHDASSLPIGRVFDFEKGAKRDNTPALFESIEYATAEMNPEADLIYRLVDGGFIKAVSVGFIPTKSSYPDTPEKREAAGLGAYGVLYEKQEQIELSQCSIPANPNALMSAAKSFAQSGAVSEKTVSRLFDALGLPAKTQIVVPELPKEDKTEEVAQHPTTLDVAALFGEMKSELLAEVRLQTQKIEALEKSVKIMRRKLASQAVNKNRSSVPEAPSATLDQHAECHTQPKSYDELFSESFESRLRAALERGEVAGGNKN